MKTKEATQKEVRSYLEKTSMHAFTKDNGSPVPVLMAIKLLEGNKFLIFENDKTRIWDYNYLVNDYNPNAKNLMKNMLFQNNGYKSIKKRKPIREQLAEAFKIQ